MQKTLLVKLVEEYYGAGKSERVYGRLAEEMRLVGHSTWMPLWRCIATLRQEFGPENVLVLGSTNDSLLACLLGAISVNPLPPHYRCNNCHYNQHVDHTRYHAAGYRHRIVRLVLQKSGQVEVVLRKHNPYRLHTALHQLRVFHTLILYLDDPLIPHGLSQRPQRVQNVLAVVGRGVVELFVGHQRPHVPLILRRHGAVDELVQNGQRVVRRQRAALQ